MAMLSFPRCVFHFFKLFQEKKSCSIFYMVQFLLFSAFALLRMNIQLPALSAVRRAYLGLEKWRISGRWK